MDWLPVQCIRSLPLQNNLSSPPNCACKNAPMSRTHFFRQRWDGGAHMASLCCGRIKDLHTSPERKWTAREKVSVMRWDIWKSLYSTNQLFIFTITLNLLQNQTWREPSTRQSLHKYVVWHLGATLHNATHEQGLHMHRHTPPSCIHTHTHTQTKKQTHTDGRFSQGWWVLFLIKTGGERKVVSFDVATHSPSVSLSETLKPFVFTQLMLIIKQTSCLC